MNPETFRTTFAGIETEIGKIIVGQDQVIEGVIAIALLLGGGLTALQTAVITTGLPFTLVLLAMCVAILG